MPAYSIHHLRRLRLDIGQNIHRLRLARRMPLAKLAALSGVSEAMLDAYELGKYEIGLRELLKIAYALEVEWGAVVKV